MAVYLGLGSNLGDRKKNLSEAISLIKKLNLVLLDVSPVIESVAQLPKTAPLDWDKNYLNLVLKINTQIEPNELLTAIKGIESQMGRIPQPRWAPRPIDIDIIYWDNVEISEPHLKIPHPRLLSRSFVLDPLSFLTPRLVLLHSNKQSETNVLTISRNHPFHSPLWMGIVNLTHDSFSDGGQLHDSKKLIFYLNQLKDNGVHIIDLGAESTRPNAQPISSAEEWQKIEPALQIIGTWQNDIIKPLISIDSYHPETIEKALKWGVNIINDVSGLQNEKIRALCRESHCQVVAMHSLTVPANKNVILDQNLDPVLTVKDKFLRQIEDWSQNGLDLNKIIIDPGIGFGKNAFQSIEILRRINEFHGLNHRILVGHSRKSCFNNITSKQFPERDLETIGASLQLCTKGIEILRVHNVIDHLRAFRAWDYLRSGDKVNDL